MVRSLGFVAAMMCVAAVASAQTPTPPSADRVAPAAPPAVTLPTTPRPATPPPSQQSAKPAESAVAATTVTYTGCLKPGATSGTWILDSAELARQVGGQASASAPAASSESAVGTSGMTKPTFTLSTKPGADLKPHANHKIEVVGTIVPAKPTAQASVQTGSEAAGASVATASVTPARQEFTVESFKMVSAACP
ncbi:MAG TPA: hypothetical protein VJM31_16125 [Vicinamibacterales bacterium]|nr:hypothetical protein [Vicinamibacterales bacterium]